MLTPPTVPTSWGSNATPPTTSAPMGCMTFDPARAMSELMVTSPLTDARL